jgi:ankyrin repeat protein
MLNFADRLLIKLGLNLNTLDKNGNTAAHVAFENNNFEFIELLLNYGIDCN